MASLVDYLRQSAGERDVDLENLAKGIGTYSRNQEVLEALNAPDRSSPIKGLGTSLLKVLAAPGRLAQAGILEAIGQPTPELQRLSGAEQLREVAFGDIPIGFGQTEALKVRAGEGVGSRVGKLLAAFALDTATDPLSYLSAPASLSRKAAAELAIRTAPKLLDDLITNSAKGAGVLDDLVARAPKTRLANLQKEVAAEAVEGTPITLATEANKRIIAGEEFGNLIGESLVKGGRREVMRALENLTGSRASALQLFKKLPEDVRGGIVVAGLTGKPVQNAAGEYIRITQGTGRAVGPLGDIANRMRLGASSVVAPALAPFSGRTGQIYRGVVRGLAQEAKEGTEIALGRDRLIDVISTKDALANRNVILTRLQGRAHAAAAQAAAAGRKYADKAEEFAAFETAYKTGVFSPQAQVDTSTLSQAQRDGFTAAEFIRKEIADLYNEAVAEGVDIGRIGTVETFSPLMLTDEAYERYSKLGAAERLDNPYRATEGRRSFIEYSLDDDPDLLDKISVRGFTDPNNPNVVYLNAVEANKVLKKRAQEAGKTADEIEQAGRTFIEDPTMVIERYGSYMSNAVANKKFIGELVSRGTIVRDPRAARSLLEEWNAATFTAAIKNLSPELRKVAEATVSQAEARVRELVEPKRLDEVRARIAKFRKDAEVNVAFSRQQEQLALETLDAADDVVERAFPAAQSVRARLVQYERQTSANATELAVTERTARNARARARTAMARFDEASNPELFSTIDPQRAEAQLVAAQQARAAAEADLSVARQGRDRLRSQEVEEQLSAINVYEQALANRNAALAQVTEARNLRTSTVDQLRSVRKEIELEEITNVDAIVNQYVRALNNLETHKLNNPISRNMDPALRAQLLEERANLTDVAQQTKRLVRDVLGANTTRFEGVAKEYAETLIDAAEKLSADQIDSLRILTSEKRLGDFVAEYVDAVGRGDRSSEELLQTMGAMYQAFKGIRELLPESAFDNLAEAQKAILDDSAFRRLQTGLLRADKVPSKLAEEIVNKGYESVNMGRKTAELYATSGVLDFMKRVYDVEAKPEGLSRFTRDMLDPLLTLWKTSVTVGRGPGYTARNLAGGMYMNYLGNVSADDHRLMAGALTKINNVLKRVEKANPNRSFYDNLLEAEAEVIPLLNQTRIGDKGLGDLVKDLFDNGGFFDTEMAYSAAQVSRLGTQAPEAAFRRGDPIRRTYATEAASPAEERLRRTVDFLMTNQVQRYFTNMAQTSEMFLRGAAFIDGYRRYGDIGAAMQKVHLLHFNYQDLGPGDLFMKRLLPFYTWTRNNVPAQMRALIMQPGKVQRAFSLNEEFQRTFGAEGDDSWLNQVLPEYINISNGFATKWKFGDNNVAAFQTLPINDIDRLLKGEGFPLRGREFGGMLGPWTTPIEVLTGTNLQTGAPFREEGEEVPGYYNIFRALGPWAGVRTGSEGETRVAPGLARTVSDLIPQLGLLERAASVIPGVNQIASSEPQRQRALTNLLNLSGVPALAGYSVTTLTPTALGGEVTRRTKVQQKGIAARAEELGIDIDWVREQLRLGRTPDEIRQLLGSGYGRAEESEQSALKPRARRTYLDYLEGLSG